MSIRWISVKKRVPDDRRNVLIWGHGVMLGKKPRFLGTDKYNSGNRFDCEIRGGIFSPGWVVTHWAEINEPDSE